MGDAKEDDEAKGCEARLIAPAIEAQKQPPRNEIFPETELRTQGTM